MTTVAQSRSERVWEAWRPITSLLGTLDHKVIGKRYILTAFLFFSLAGLEAFLMRIQLAKPDNTFLSPETYNQFFTLHGTTMIFFFATPMLFGFGNYLVPLMIGSRAMAFPRLNAFSYWVFLFSGLFMYSSVFFGMAPDGGSSGYTPLSGRQYSPGLNLDFWSLGLIFLSIATTAGAINFIVTTLKMRAPGMSLTRMPLFCWAILVASFAVLFAFPPVTVANLFLTLQRRFDFQFFISASGGSALLWRRLFWVFGDLVLYILFLPAAGMVSEIVATFSRRRILGYTLLVTATVAIGILGFGVWIHHMFAVPVSPAALSFFSVSSAFISIFGAIQALAWLGTMLSGGPIFRTPLLYVAGFIFLFVVGALTGVMFSVAPFDPQVTGSYFGVAHLHYVLVGGVVFPIFAALCYWFPKMTGRMLNARLGVWSFWLTFIGFNLTFFPMHINGLLGMPRRVYTYAGGLGWDGLNLLETISAVVHAVGILLFVINLLSSWTRGEMAGDNPWEGSSLEWATTSPPPPYNFETLPEVKSRNPLWAEPPGRKTEKDKRETPAFLMPDDPTDFRNGEALSTSVREAVPEGILQVAAGTATPFWLAASLCLLFIGVLVGIWWLAAIAAAVSLALVIVWFWPEHVDAEGGIRR